MTKEQFEKLEPYKEDIMRAYKNSFVHMSGADFNKVAGIYAEITGKGLTKSQMNCNTCRLNALRKLGEMYSTYTESQEQKVKKTRPKKLEDKKNEE